MWLVAASLQPFDLGEFTAAPRRLPDLRRPPQLMLSSPPGATTRSLRQFKPLPARSNHCQNATGRGQRPCVARFARAVRMRHAGTYKESAEQTWTDIACDEDLA